MHTAPTLNASPRKILVARTRDRYSRFLELAKGHREFHRQPKTYARRQANIYFELDEVSPFMGSVASATSDPGGVIDYRRAIVAGLGPLILGFVLVSLTSCMVGPNYKTPQASVEAKWMGAPSSSRQRTKIAQAYWWKCFRDPVLDRLIKTAYTNSPSLQATGVRILQARAQLNQAIGNLFPQQQGLSGEVNYTRLSTPERAFVPAGLTPNYVIDKVLFSSSWEIDFWGKYRRTIESDRATFFGTVASYDDALVTLIADVATSYVNIRTLEERIRVAEQNAETQRQSHQLTETQFKAGETDELDMRQAETLLRQTEAQIPQLQNTLNQAKNGLAVQLGVTPDEVDRLLKGPSHIPVARGEIAAGIPHDLLRRRPDVRAAGLTAASQNALIGVARANMFPALSLSGEFGFHSNDELNHSLSGIFSWQSKAVQAGASFVWPVFNYGRLVNQVRVQDAQFQQAILNYQNTVLTAQQEVENGLSAFYTGLQALSRLTAAAAAAHRSTELSLIQYRAGETNYTTVLSTQQAQLGVDDSVASSRGSVALGLISIYRALGGGWELRQGGDVISDEVKTEMGRRTNWGRMLKPEYHVPATSPEQTPE
jgi:NodT family efflux transporter outer membrane factor (OMF) lipoprotein